MKTVGIIGAGPAGVASAAMLAQRGYRVVLLDKAADILAGASRVAFILHYDGIEYFNLHDNRTTLDCIDGGIALKLMYPDMLYTSVCGPGNEIRFGVSNESARHIPEPRFFGNLRSATEHYSDAFATIMEINGWSAEQTAQILHGYPENFIRRMSPADYSDISDLAFGCFGSGRGLNMPHFFAAIKTIFQSLPNLQFIPNAHTESITGHSGQRRITLDDGRTLDCDHVVIAAGYDTPELISRTQGAVNEPQGYYFLNCMSHIRLPALKHHSPDPARQQELLAKLKKINFILQGDGGCSFVCLYPPTADMDGAAVSYTPSKMGNQIIEHKLNGADGPRRPTYFDEIIKNGLTSDEQKFRKEFCLNRIFNFYQFLDGYISADNIKFVYGSVYSPHGPGSQRSIRHAIESTEVTRDGSVRAVHASKFTTHVLHAMDIVKKITERDERRDVAANGLIAANFNRKSDAGLWVPKSLAGGAMRG